MKHPTLPKWLKPLIFPLLAISVAVQPSSAKSSGDTPAPMPADTCPIKAGEALPSLLVKAADGTSVDLAVSVMEKPTLLVFYRGGW